MLYDTIGYSSICGIINEPFLTEMVALTGASVVLVIRRGGWVSWQGGLPFGEADDAVDFLHGSRELRQWSPFSPAFKNKFKLVHFRNNTIQKIKACILFLTHEW